MPAIPPVAPRRPHELTAHDHTRRDDWYWLRDRDDPDVIAYLEAENRYADEVLAPARELEDRLYADILSRVRETDAGPPSRHGPWWYYSRTEEGLQYPVMCRRPDAGRSMRAADVAAEARAGRPADEEVVLDENLLGAGRDYLAVGVFDVSPDQRLLAYAVDVDGSEEYTLRFRDLAAGADLPDVIERVYYGSACGASGESFFYVKPDDAMRPWQVWCHKLGAGPADDRLVFQEDDEHFFVGLALSRSRSRIVIHSSSKTSSEAHWVDAADPDCRVEVIIRRQPGIEYDAEHDGQDWLIRTNRPGPDGSPAANFALYRLVGGDWEEVVAHRRDVKLEGVDAFAGFVAVAERSARDGLERLRIIDGPDQHVIEQPEPVYSLLAGQNPDWDQPTYRFGYTSLVTPPTSVDYRVATRARERVWTQLVGGGYDPSRYRTERIWAKAADGARVPVSILCRNDQRDVSPPGVLYGYGAYEMSSDPTFSVSTINLVERGMVFAIAHVRGGGELGRAWYEAGRMANKPNTFGDFIAAAEELVSGGWVRPDGLVARGASAGGLLVGAVVNTRPDLFRAAVAEVPFVDVVTTMSDVTLPLTVTEWEEWGDPLHDPEAYRTMLAYSPYDNVRAAPCSPALFVTAGLYDPNVGFWEPAKWVAKLRAVGAGSPDRPVVLRTEMGAGHLGLSGRYDAWRDEARIQAFILTQFPGQD
ncbi:MAG: S9 family peptidase [Acidimicrobiales bacterium]|nr:S9 family peptidase [Acidimicrobiales bacterium]